MPRQLRSASLSSLRNFAFRQLTFGVTQSPPGAFSCTTRDPVALRGRAHGDARGVLIRGRVQWSRAGRLPLPGNSALKVIPNEMQDFGSVHDCSSLSLRKSEERQTHYKYLARRLREGRDFDDSGGFFPPNAFAANSANARVLCAETTFPRLSPRAMTAKANPLPIR